MIKLRRSRHRWDSFGGLFVSCENLIASCHLTMKFLVLWGFHTKWTTFKFQKCNFCVPSTDTKRWSKKGGEASDIYSCLQLEEASFVSSTFVRIYSTSQQAVFSVMTMTCLKRFSDNPWRNKNDQAGPFSVRWCSLVLVAGDWSSFSRLLDQK